MRTDTATRAAVLTLKAIGQTTTDVAHITGLSVRLVNLIFARATAQGFDPHVRPIKITNAMVADAPRSGRPRKQTEESTALVTTNARLDRHGQEKSCTDIAGELSQDGLQISATTVWRILKKSGIQGDGTNDEAWIDEEEEIGTPTVVS